MKTLFKISSGIVLASLALVPILAFADITAPVESCNMRYTVEDCPAIGLSADFDTNYGKQTGAVCCLMSTIGYITQWVFLILMAVAVSLW